MDKPSTVLCVGGISFRKITGSTMAIEDVRGYIFSPRDCVAVATKTRSIIGNYKSAGRDREGNVRKVGDPKWGWITSEQKVALPPSVRWIISVLDPISVQRSGLRTIVALKADLARVGKSLGDSFAPLACSFLTFPVALGTDEGPVAIDIETVGESISRVGVSDGRCTWTAPWDWRSAARITEIFGSGRRIVGHNLAFDLRYLHREITIVGRKRASPLFDTMVAAHLLQPDLYKGLARSASLYLNIAHWKWLGTDSPEYNAKDAFYTWKLAEAEEVHLQETGQAELFHKTLMPALPVLIRMTERGLRVDRPRLSQWQEELAQKQHLLLEEWNAAVPNVNPLSPPQIAKWLYRDNGFPAAKTKYGKTTVDEGALKAILGRVKDGALAHGIRTLLAFKKVAKLRSTYAKVEIGGDGCVHPNYLPAGKESDSGAAATGRLASSDPNIQNQPEEARKLFTAKIPSWSLVEVDYSQIELRIAATLANDSDLLEALKGNVHKEVSEMLGCDYHAGKTFVYSLLFGAGARKQARVLRTEGYNVSEAQCYKWRDQFAARFKKLWEWRTQIPFEAASNQYLTDVFGRRRYFYDAYIDDNGIVQGNIPQMINTPPQSNAAGIMWNRLVPLDAFCDQHGGAILATVHDSFLMEFPKEAITPCLLGGLREILETEFPQIGPQFRVPVDMKIGSNWGQMEKLSPELVRS